MIKSKQQIVYQYIVYIIFSSILLLLLLCAVYKRNEVYSTNLTIWTDLVIKSPSKARVHHNLGESYQLLGRYDEAILEYRKSLELDKSYIETYWSFYLLGQKLENKGYFSQAAYCYLVVCNEAPSLFHNYKNRACISADKLIGK